MQKNEMDFVTEVSVEIDPFDKGLYADEVKIMLPYDVDLEYRSWGIKGFCPILPYEITINYFERSWDDDSVEVERSITVQPNELKREWVKSTDGIGCPESIFIALKNDGSVDYEMSAITFWYCEP